jgi:hypothetical protein
MSDTSSLVSLGLGAAKFGIQQSQFQAEYEILKAEMARKNNEALRLAQRQRSQEQNQGSAIGQFFNRGFNPWPGIASNQWLSQISNPMKP